MAGTRPRSPAAASAPTDPRWPERLALVTQRLATGYYQRPEVLDQIADSMIQALAIRSREST